MTKPDGYRYVRSYRILPGKKLTMAAFEASLRWALWEVQQGKARRVGTAKSESQYRAFLGLAELSRLGLASSRLADES